MNVPESIRFQHLIDPEDCARCGSCEMECARGAISHDERNYVVDADKCENCLQCLAVCSTGSIDSWLPVRPGHEYSLAQQLSWDALPHKPLLAADAAVQKSFSADALAVADAVQHAAPVSAATPQINVFSAHNPAQAMVIESWRPTAGNDIRHIVLDFGEQVFPVLEGQTIGVLTPGTDASGRAHAMRAYSVASARDGEHRGSNTIALTVKRIVENHEGEAVRGVCSNYLCDLAVGDRVQIVGPFGQSFLAPNAPGSQLLMICTGTGIAPMRGMIERRQRVPVNDGCDLTLFYGARAPADMAYYADLAKLPPSSLDLNLAFSRVPGRSREYVQDLLLRRSERVMELLLDEQCYIYLCGVRGMEAGVMQAFTEICLMHGCSWSDMETKLREQRRLHIEIY